MLKVFSNSIRIDQNPDNSYNHSRYESDVVKSVFHVLLLPLGLALGSPLAGAIYFIFAVGVYFTIFREKNYYVIGVLKTVGGMVFIMSAWILLIGFVGSLGAAL